MSGTCFLAGCGRPAESRGWCKRHYGRVLDHGHPGVTRENTVGGVVHRYVDSRDIDLPDDVRKRWAGCTIAMRDDLPDDIAAQVVVVAPDPHPDDTDGPIVVVGYLPVPNPPRSD